jgi:hypothetical protein
MTGKNNVTVGSALCGETGMKFVVHRFGPQYDHILRQIGIGSKDPGSLVPLGPGLKMDNLSGGMYTGVSASGTHHTYRVIGNFGKGLLYLPLYHTDILLLILPPGEVTAVVFNTYCNSHYLSL